MTFKFFFFLKVEDLVLACWNEDLDAVGIVQRTNCFPSTNRGTQLKHAFAFFAFQNLMDVEEVKLCGKVTVSIIIQIYLLLFS